MGPGRWREFLAVTLPGLKGPITVALTVTVISALRAFDLVFVTTRGGPGTETVVPGILIYRRAFEDGRLGSASGDCRDAEHRGVRGDLPHQPNCGSESAVTAVPRTGTWSAAILISFAAITVLPILGIVLLSLQPPETQLSGFELAGPPALRKLRARLRSRALRQLSAIEPHRQYRGGRGNRRRVHLERLCLRHHALSR